MAWSLAIEPHDTRRNVQKLALCFPWRFTRGKRRIGITRTECTEGKSIDGRGSMALTIIAMLCLVANCDVLVEQRNKGHCLNCNASHRIIFRPSKHMKEDSSHIRVSSSCAYRVSRFMQD